MPSYEDSSEDEDESAEDEVGGSVAGQVDELMVTVGLIGKDRHDEDADKNGRVDSLNGLNEADSSVQCLVSSERLEINRRI